jgi:hypothetical protein
MAKAKFTAKAKPAKRKLTGKARSNARNFYAGGGSLGGSGGGSYTTPADFFIPD